MHYTETFDDGPGGWYGWISNAAGPKPLEICDSCAISRSPWWIDSLEVGTGEEFEIAFVADNPGIWMDHCHNLPHAAEGLVAHLMYGGVSSSYRIGDDPGNHPE